MAYKHSNSSFTDLVVDVRIEYVDSFLKDRLEIKKECEKLTKETGLPAYDVLKHGADKLVEQLKNLLKL